MSPAMSPATYLLALNCGSSSIKGRLFALPTAGAGSPRGVLEDVARIAVSNIGAKGDTVQLKIGWEAGRGEDVKQEGGEGATARHADIFPLILDNLAHSGGVHGDQIKYITHRIVHGGLNTKPLIVTHEHEEALTDMDALSEFAPLHNHHAVLGVRACLSVLPSHTSVLLFDTLFHQTLPREVYTYALPPADAGLQLPIPLRKYGFHGLSYASIVRTLSARLNKPADTLNLVVAHLGSGASACCIHLGKSIDTTMGLTPLEGLVGGTRTGTIDPTAIFHHTRDVTADSGITDMHVSRAEYVLNKESGLTALAGTQNFGLITQRIADPSSCTPEQADGARLAYDVFLDRLMGFLAAYLSKLLFRVPMEDVALVFSGGIGENSKEIRADVLRRLAWLGARVDEEKNAAAAQWEGGVRRVSAEGSTLKAYVVLTDEEQQCAIMARNVLGI